LSLDVNQAVAESRKRGALTVVITNEPHSSLSRLANEVFMIRAGKERAVAAT
jgi:glucosamine 6-phosphate synthetase-like amidotransferase/phosphosugar isomerase protein